jgi:uncharacterized protein (TIGR02996 family)
MHQMEAFLQAIAENPQDDELRLVFADWLEEQGATARAEFIRAQVELARLPRDAPHRPRLEARAQALLAAHERAWGGELATLASGWEFQRGFIVGVTLKARDFLAHGDRLFESAPLLRRLGLRAARALIEPLAHCPLLARLEALDLAGNRLGGAEAVALFASPHLDGLRELDLGHNRIGATLDQVLAVLPRLPALSRLCLAANGLEGDQAVALAGCADLGRLTVLELAGNRLAGVDFHRGWLDVHQGGSWALANSPHLAGLRRLDLSDNYIGDYGTENLATSPHLEGLRELLLEENGVWERGALALAVPGRLPGLEMLSLRGNDVGAAARRALRNRFGSRVVL